MNENISFFQSYTLHKYVTEFQEILVTFTEEILEENLIFSAVTRMKKAEWEITTTKCWAEFLK